MLRSECWTAAMPDTFFCLRTLQKICAEYRHWQPCLQDLGQCEVKHGLRLHLFNLYKDGLGNPQVPEKLKRRMWNQGPVGHNSAALAQASAWNGVNSVGRSHWRAVFGSLFIGQSKNIAEVPKEGATASIPEKSIAVLPFENFSA